MSRFLAAGLAGAAILAAGTAAGGYFIGKGVLDQRLANRSVTVKGVAEQELSADLATYPLRVTVTAAEIAEGERRLSGQIAEIVAFLRDYGFEDSEITLRRLEAQDILSQPYRPKDVDPKTRFILNQSVMLRSTKIALVSKLSQSAGELVRRGILLSDGGGPNYIVTAERLNALKPELIRRATAAAKTAAGEFAAASESEVGGIRNANQGVIAVLPRDDGYGDESRSPDKRLRAVTTVEYLLVR
ncbi:MAG TPA: SIMPL domain-containing protein [Alphaproteobacteria bacterium]|nr:SIMPL domain-containing protein [Alphaproteobacteria bacterium]